MNVKNTLIIALLYTILACQGHAHAFDLDETVDDEIRKNYGTQEENLPALPAITKHLETTKTADIKSQNPVQEKTPPQNYPIYKGGNIKIKKGTSFNVTNLSQISDWQHAGAQVKFKTKQPIYGKNYTIPVGTIFNGEVVESHQPQITCNGGLVVIKINSMIYKGQTVYINAYVTRANDKKIFLNNIKGERKYLKTMWQKGNWGRTLFNKMCTLTVNLGSEGSTFILSPFPLAYGTICLGANTIISPFSAFFAKGGHVSIPSGRNFRIKLIDEILL